MNYLYICPLRPHRTDRNFYSLRKTLPMYRGHGGTVGRAARVVTNPEEYTTNRVTRADVRCENRKWLYSLIYVLFKKRKQCLNLWQGRYKGSRDSRWPQVTGLIMSLTSLSLSLFSFLCGLQVFGGFFAEDLNTRERSKGSDGVRYERCACFCSRSFREKRSQPVTLKGSGDRDRRSNRHHERQVSNSLKHDFYQSHSAESSSPEGRLDWKSPLIFIVTQQNI